MIRTSAARVVSLDFLVPALIGAISLSAAFLTWGSLSHSDHAGESASRFMLERVREENVLARAAVDTGAYLDGVALAAVELDVARELEARAGSLSPGDPQREVLDSEAADLRRVGTERLAGNGYGVVDGNAPAVDEEDLRTSLVRYYEGLVPPRPKPLADAAADERDSSARLARIVLALAIAGVVATVAHVTRHRLAKLIVASFAGAVWVGVLVVAATGIG